MPIPEIGHRDRLYNVLEVGNHNVPQKESNHSLKCTVINVLDQLNIKLHGFLDW